VRDGHLHDVVAEVDGGDGDEAVHAAGGAAGVADGIAQEPEGGLPADDGSGAPGEVVLACVGAVALNQKPRLVSETLLLSRWDP
jgi:hypothetical protein